MFFVVFNVKLYVKLCKVRQQNDQILDNSLHLERRATIKIVAKHSGLNTLIQPCRGGKRCSNQMLFILWSYFSLEMPGTKPAEERLSTEAVAERVNLRRIAMTRATYCQRRAEQRHSETWVVAERVNGFDDGTGFKSFVVKKDCRNSERLWDWNGVVWK